MISMLPGPTSVPESVMRSMLDSGIYHRSDEFHEIFDEIQVNLRGLLKTKRSVYVLTSSGTGGIEAIVTNILKPTDKALVVVNGYFSEGLADLIEAFGIHAIRLDLKWNAGIVLDLVEQALKREKQIRAVAVAYVETSTGSRADLEELADLCARFDAFLVVDGESAIAGEDLCFDDWNVGACVGGTQKCLCSPPGLSLVAISEEGWDAITSKGHSGFYFDLQRYSECSERHETPFTPALPLFFALRESLRLIGKEGLEARIKRHRECAHLLRDGLAGMNLKPYVPLDYCSNVCTAVDISGTRTSASQIVKKVLSCGVSIAAGLGPLKEQVIRIGTMGTVTTEDVSFTLAALRKVIEE